MMNELLKLAKAASTNEDRCKIINKVSEAEINEEITEAEAKEIIDMIKGE